MESRLLSDIYMHFVLSGKDTRFTPEAYGFVLASLDFERSRSGVDGHIKAPILVKAVADLAVLKFGPLAETVMKSWGVVESKHIGEIVYNLIDMEILTKTNDDKLEQFFDAESLEFLLNKRDLYRINASMITPFHDA